MTKLLIIAFVFSVTAAFGRSFIIAGPLKPETYPLSYESPYLLPWEAGVSHFCFQGNQGLLSHKGRSKYAWDFLMPIGTRVVAARSGTVVFVVDSHEGRGLNKPNNEIYIDHGDETKARYAHIKKNGSKVKLGDIVRQGQVLALSGDVGRSLGPHLHFEVVNKNRESIPISFVEVTEHAGVPRASYQYTSKNSMN